MHKIPTLFVRDFTDPRNPVLTDQVAPGCEWVLAGEGVATRKYDGVSIKFDGTAWWARRMVKAGKPAPVNYQPVVTDETTGHTFGWEPVEQSAYVKMWREAVEPILEFGALISGSTADTMLPAGTFELIGPKINGNPENARHHRLEPHANAERICIETRQGACVCSDEAVADGDCPHPWIIHPNPNPWDLVLLAQQWGYEGIVWHHREDDRMAKLKVRDLRQRPAPAQA